MTADRPAAGATAVGADPVIEATEAVEIDEGIDPQALHDLVVEHGDAVYRLAMSIVRDNALAEDIAQDTMVKAWLALPTLRSDTSLRSWVLRIAHNTAISTLRTRRAVVVDPAGDAGSVRPFLSGPSKTGFRAAK